MNDEPGPGREADRELLLQAAELRRPIARAAKLGRMNGTGYVVFGALSLVMSLPLDIPGLAIGAVLLGVGISERKQAGRLLSGELDAPKRLALGELVLMVAILVYSLVKLTVLRELGNELEAELRAIDPSLGEMTDALARTTAATLIAIALLYQGSMALRFHRLAPAHLRYVTKVPPWARAVLED